MAKIYSIAVISISILIISMVMMVHSRTSMTKPKQGAQLCYDFTDVTRESGPHHAFANDVDRFPYQTQDDLNAQDSVEATNQEYIAIAAPDNDLAWMTANPGPEDHIFLQVETLIDDFNTIITSISFLLNGFVEGTTSTLEIWVHRADSDPLNGDNWDRMGKEQVVPDGQPTDVTANLTCDFENYIDPAPRSVRWGVYVKESPAHPLHIHFIQLCVCSLPLPQPTGTGTRQISARVTDKKTGQPIPVVRVNGTYTDENGFYCITIVQMEFIGFTLSAEKEDYESFYRTYSWPELFTESFDIELIPLDGTEESAVQNWSGYGAYHLPTNGDEEIPNNPQKPKRDI